MPNGRLAPRQYETGEPITQEITPAGLRRYTLPGEQGYMELSPEFKLPGKTGTLTRLAPSEPILGPTPTVTEEEKAKARLVDIRYGAMPAKSAEEKDLRRQHLIRKAAEHGVPQGVLAQQMALEGVQIEEPKPMVTTPYGELPADVGFRYLPKEVGKPAVTPSEKLYRHPKTRDLMFVNVRSPEDIQAVRKKGYRPAEKDGKNGVGKGRGGGKKPPAALYARGEFAIARQMSKKTTGEISDYLDMEGKFNRNLLYKDLDERNTRIYDKASVLKDAYVDEGLNPEAAAKKALEEAEKLEPSTPVKTLDADTASEFLQQAGGNKEAARELAREQGYQF